jgi:hypothetical protein
VQHRFTLPIVSKVIKKYHAINIQGASQTEPRTQQGYPALREQVGRGPSVLH